jgi:hypothetical protein
MYFSVGANVSNNLPFILLCPPVITNDVGIEWRTVNVTNKEVDKFCVTVEVATIEKIKRPLFIPFQVTFPVVSTTI